MRSATRGMAQAQQVSLDDVEQLQAQLVPHLPGLRQEQVWIGGANPMVAQFVPPKHQLVRPLMDDLLAYLNDPSDTAVVAAAVVHAQFETIHPFRDGNGRIGRALTHTVLARTRTVPTVIPFSRVFAARKQAYIEGLTDWRTHDGADGRVVWVAAFAEAIIEAAGLAQQMARELVEVQNQRPHDHRPDEHDHRALGPHRRHHHDHHLRVRRARQPEQHHRHQRKRLDQHLQPARAGHREDGPGRRYQHPDLRRSR
jgi:Fic family protein